MLSFGVIFAVASAPGYAAPKRPASADPLETYVGARTAGMVGDYRRSAELYAALAAANPGDRIVAGRAVAQAISAGDMALALKLAREIVKNPDLGVDARLLLVADELRNGREGRGLALLKASGSEPDLSFLAPIVEAWAAVRRDGNRALDMLSQVPVGSPVGARVSENRALILLQLGKTVDADPYARRAVGMAGGRENHVRLALADAFLKAHDGPRALEMVAGRDVALGIGRRMIEAGRPTGSAIDTPAKAYSELLLGLAVDLNRANSKALPIALAQVARYADPANAQAAIILGLLLDADDRTDVALAAFRAVDPANPLASQARDGEARSLTRAKRYGEALAMAQRATRAPDATSDDWSRLGDVLSAMDHEGEAADAYGRAMELAETSGIGSELWTLYLLRGGALERANRWPEAKQALEAALKLSPQQPLVLNYLGYAKLERGEDLDGAEAMIAKASELAPEDASITDSLGWAQYKRGRLPQAIATLQKAAATDPAQVEIHEHLGDALYAAGRRFEARFAWEAAKVGAEDDVAKRLKAKLEAGLTVANAAP
ncbi:MAG TPA: tetratricopeptide repeat protein [Sphingomicrobium sp.]|nr:tetratricopeptide repeat protein [Sphingomicrobium sp.]